jgi:hypothetical protein
VIRFPFPARGNMLRHTFRTIASFRVRCLTKQAKGGSAGGDADIADTKQLNPSVGN